jgi:hypothetical protein
MGRACFLIPFVNNPTKGDIAIIMKKRSLFKTAFSFLFFSASCPGAFDPALELDIKALHAAPTLTFPEEHEMKDLPSAPPQDLGPYFSLLPPERMLDLISYLDAKSLLAFSQTCKTIDDLVGHSAKKDLTHATQDCWDVFYEPARLKKGALSALQNDGYAFLAPGTLLPQGARPLDSLESLAFFNQIFSTHKENLIDADLLCLGAVCPLALVSNNSKAHFAHALKAFTKKPSVLFPLIRFQVTLDSKQLQAPSTLVLTTSELKTYKDALSAHLAHNPEHRVHLILGDGAFMENGALSMKSDDLPDNLCHLILSDPAGYIHTIRQGFLLFHSGLTTVDIKDLRAVTLIEGFFLSECKNLVQCNPRGLTSLSTIERSFLERCRKLKGFRTRSFISLARIGVRAFGNCTSLETFDPTGLTALTSQMELFLQGCTALPETEKEKIRAHLAARGIEWR